MRCALVLVVTSSSVSACLDGRTLVPDQKADTGAVEPGATTSGEMGGSPDVPDLPPDEPLPDLPADTEDPMSGFITPPGDGGPSFECDVFAQDCGPGEKCMPYAGDGGASWTSTGCFPIARDPAGEGEPCTVVGSGVSGIDDCGAGLMCWNVDENLEGHCEDFCTGSADNPICDDPNEFCPIAGDGVIVLCIERCDPLAQDCALDNEVCYPIHGDWGCAPDASGRMGAYGDPCRYINGCDEGHVCLGAAAFTSCAGAVGCCSLVCDTSDEASDAMCAALDPGQSCESWYSPRNAPAGYELLGVCALPA